jgi:hypothetical protein
MYPCTDHVLALIALAACDFDREFGRGERSRLSFANCVATQRRRSRDGPTTLVYIHISEVRSCGTTAMTSTGLRAHGSVRYLAAPSFPYESKTRAFASCGSNSRTGLPVISVKTVRASTTLS